MEQSTLSSTMAMLSLRTNWKPILLILLCTGIVYARSLQFDFVTYDDYELVYQNGDYLSHPSNILASFTTHAFTTHRLESAYYRPVLLISYILDYHVWNLRPFGYHLTNILLHAFSAIIVLFLLAFFIGDRILGLMGSLWFALHPIQTESVAWVAGRNDVLLGLFVALMMLFYILSHEYPLKKNYFVALSLLSWILALCTKEAAAFYFLLLPLYDGCVRRLPMRSLISSKRWIIYLLFVILLVGYFMIRLRVFGEFIGAERLYGTLPFGTRLANIPALISEHCRLIVAPFALSVVHPMEQMVWLSMPWPIVAVIISVALLAVIVMTFRRDASLSFGMMWFCVGLIPVLGIFPVAVPILEHRLYLPFVGVVIVATRLFQRLADRLHRPRVVYGIAAVLGLIAGGMSSARLPVWRDSAALWSDAIGKAPTIGRSYFNLAGYYFERQQYDKTIELLKQYIALRPEDFMGYSKLRQSYFLAGMYPEAAGVNRELIRHNPTNPNRYLEGGLMFEQIGWLDSAAVIFEDGVRVDSDAIDLHIHLAQLYVALGRWADAMPHAQRIAQLAPHDARGYFLLGKLAANDHQDQRAIAWIEQGLPYGEPPQEISKLLENLYRRTGKGEKTQH